MVNITGLTAPNGSYLVTSSGNFYNHISTNTTTVVKSTPGILHTITVNTAGATDTATVYDNTAGSGTIIGVLGTTVGSFIYDVAFGTGLTIVTAGTTAPDITVSYQ